THSAAGILEVRAQPAHLAGSFLKPALPVERDQALENVLVAKIDGPAIGLGHGGVDAVVNFLQDADQALLVDNLVLALDRLARAQLFQHVVHLRERELGMLFLSRLAMGVEFLTEVANDLGLGAWAALFHQNITKS